MQEEHFECYWDLLSRIASLEDEAVSVRNESFEFSDRFITSSNARLLSDGKKLDVSSFEVPITDQARMLRLLLTSEKRLDDVRIEDWFSRRFFASNFWTIFQTMFAFQKWSSVIEMKRYMERFIHLVPGLEKLQGVMRTKYNRCYSIVGQILDEFQWPLGTAACKRWEHISDDQYLYHTGTIKSTTDCFCGSYQIDYKNVTIILPKHNQ